MTTEELVLSILAAAVRSGTPILYATLGEIFAERSGVLNLGVEGMMLVGALSGFMATLVTGSPQVGFLVAMAAGGAVSLIHAVLSVSLKCNQIVSGLALTIFGAGLSGFLGKRLIGQPAPGFDVVSVPVLSDIPIVGQIFFKHDPLVYVTYGLVPACWLLLFRSRLGLSIRAVGENPVTADAMGLDVTRMRYFCVALGGLLAGAGGGYLSLAYTSMWIENMTAGRGWIAVALVIFATWDPLKAALGSYLFGGVNALELRIQAIGTTVPVYFLMMTPYLFTILVLAIATRETVRRRIGAPAALGFPFIREEKR